MRIKDYTDMVRHLTDSFNIPEARRIIAENPALTQEQFTANRLKWMEEPTEQAPWDKPETPWSEEPKEPYPWEAKEGGVSQLVQPGPGRPGYSGWRKGSPGYDAMLAKGRELRAKAPEGMVWDDKLKKYRKSRIDLHTASNEVKKILEDLPKGSNINRLEIIKKTNVNQTY
jgi:hypothetical protein